MKTVQLIALFLEKKIKKEVFSLYADSTWSPEAQVWAVNEDGILVCDTPHEAARCSQLRKNSAIFSKAAEKYRRFPRIRKAYSRYALIAAREAHKVQRGVEIRFVKFNQIEAFEC